MYERLKTMSEISSIKNKIKSAVGFLNPNDKKHRGISDKTEVRNHFKPSKESICTPNCIHFNVPTEWIVVCSCARWHETGNHKGHLGVMLFPSFLGKTNTMVIVDIYSDLQLKTQRISVHISFPKFSSITALMQSDRTSTS